MSKVIRRHTEISRHTFQTKIIRIGNSNSELIFCPLCATNVLGLSYQNAALIFGVSEETLRIFTEDKTIHVFENEILCLNSLKVFYEKEIRIVED